GRDLKEFETLAARLRERLAPGARVLEVAPGPGFLAIELARGGTYSVTGLDISRSFVEIAGQNAAQAGVQVDFQLGDAAAMPFEDGSFDFLVCRAAFKNFSRPVQALCEMHRVLAPGGSALIIDLRADAPRSSINATVDEMGMNRINAR